MKKIKNIFSSVLVGIIFIIGGTILLAWNEGNNVKNIKAVKEARDILVNVSSEIVQTDNNGKLIATNGEAKYTEAYLLDTMFNVKVDKSMKLVRTVEVYQWDEDKDDDDGNVTYSYTKKWDEDLIDSSKFHKTGYDNPTSVPYSNMTIVASNVKVGEFDVTMDQINSLSADADVKLDKNTLTIPEGYSITDKYITNSSDLNNPKIGDIRISYEYLNDNDLSLLGSQSGKRINPYVTSNGKKIYSIKSGIYTGEELINLIEDANNFLKWILRIVGILLLMIACAALLTPITAVLNIIPLVGKHISGFINFMGMIVGLVLSFVIIGISWIAVRPALGITLLVCAGGLITLVVTLISKKKKEISVEDNTQVAVDYKEPTETINPVNEFNNIDNNQGNMQG